MRRVAISKVVFREGLYPRFDIDNEVVERYRANIESLPPIVISKDYLLVDGKHRLRAHQLEGLQEIDADVLDISEDEVLAEAIRRNAIHGEQLSREEKKDLAQRLYSDYGVDGLVELLAVKKSVVYDWTKEQRKEEKQERDAEIVRLYLECKTQAEIAEELGVTQKTISNILVKIPEMEKLLKPPESLQLYDVWNFAKLDRSYGQDYPGRIPGQIVENVLWYWTKPLDVVCDPMAGGGTTIDVCDAMYRRCHAYDVNPVHDRVQLGDIRDGYPGTAPKSRLIFLDPPYFLKKAEEYNLPDELLTREGFLAFAADWVSFCVQGLEKNGIVALLVSDYVDYGNSSQSLFSLDCALPFLNTGCFDWLYKISVPLSTQQYKQFHVERAKTSKRLLIRGRELYIFKKGTNNG